MRTSVAKTESARTIGRYVLFREVAHGGMATVHLGRLRGPAGFARTVAIKRLHPPFARNPEFVAMFLDEARMAARIQHPNVVSVLDVVAADGELFLVMDYVHGESLQKLLAAAKEKGVAVPPRIVNGILTGVLYGLHAAHEARSERGDPLDLVHRDVSPQNVLVGVDGVARVLDFGIAKATMRMHETTRDGQLKGKVPYMAPEQLAGTDVDRRADVYAAAVMLWEGLAGERLFPPADTFQIATMVVSQKHVPPSAKNPQVSPELDAIAMKGLARDPADRYATAREMALALEAAGPTATTREVGEWAGVVADDQLRSRSITLAEIEGTALPKHVSDRPRQLPSNLDSTHIRAAAAATAAPRPRAVAAVPVDATSVDAATAGDASPAGDTAAVTGAALVALPPPPKVPVLAPAAPIDEEPALPVPRWASRRVLVVASLGLLAVFVVGGALTCVTSRSVPPPAAVLAPPTTAAPSIPPPTAEATAEPAVAPTAPAASAPSPSARPPALAARPPAPRTTTTARPASPTRADCNPPYTVDGQGVKVPKRQCF